MCRIQSGMVSCNCPLDGSYCALQQAAAAVIVNRANNLGFNQSHKIAKDAVDPRGAQAMALFMQLDERGKKTALAMLAVAVKLHAEVPSA